MTTLQIVSLSWYIGFVLGTFFGIGVCYWAWKNRGGTP